MFCAGLLKIALRDKPVTNVVRRAGSFRAEVSAVTILRNQNETWIRAVVNGMRVGVADFS